MWFSCPALVHHISFTKKYFTFCSYCQLWKIFFLNLKVKIMVLRKLKLWYCSLNYFMFRLILVDDGDDFFFLSFVCCCCVSPCDWLIPNGPIWSCLWKFSKLLSRASTLDTQLISYGSFLHFGFCGCPSRSVLSGRLAKEQTDFPAQFHVLKRLCPDSLSLMRQVSSLS